MKKVKQAMLADEEYPMTDEWLLEVLRQRPQVSLECYSFN